MLHHLRLAAAILCCAGGIAQAQNNLQPINTTGNAFYAACTPQSGHFYTGCVYYLIGYTDGLNLTNALLKSEGKPQIFCMPSAGNNVLGSVTGVQSVDIMMNYLQRNPQRRHEYTAGLIIEAFKEAFPCRG